MCSIQFDQGLNRLCYMLNGELLNDLRLPAVDTKTEIILGYIGPILIRVFSLTLTWHFVVMVTGFQFCINLNN